jgi:hypothetical protein
MGQLSGRTSSLLDLWDAVRGPARRSGNREAKRPVSGKFKVQEMHAPRHVVASVSAVWAVRKRSNPAQNHDVASMTSPKRIQLVPFHRASCSARTVW